ncbi:MAG: MFS transporter, partial [Thermoplasmata archaeon]
SFGSAIILALLGLFLARGVGVVLGLWAVNSLFNGLSRPAQSAMIGDVTGPELAVTAFGVQRVFSNTGFAISPAVGGFLAASVGLPSLFFFGALSSVAEGAILLALLRESHRSSDRRPSGTRAAIGSLLEPFRDRLFVLLLLTLSGLALVMNQFGTPLSLYLGSYRGIAFTDFGLIYALNGVLVVLLQLPIGRLIERRQHYLAAMSLGTLAYGASFLLFDLATGLPAFLAAMAVLTLGEDVVSPTEQTLVAGMTGAERRGRYFGAYNATTNATRVIAPVLGTALLGLGVLGGDYLWGTMAAVAAAVAAGFLALRSHARHRLKMAGAERAGMTAELLLSGPET